MKIFIHYITLHYIRDYLLKNKIENGRILTTRASKTALLVELFPKISRYVTLTSDHSIVVFIVTSLMHHIIVTTIRHIISCAVNFRW